jgi:hypothetical protein
LHARPRYAIKSVMRWLRHSFLGLHLALLALAMQFAAGSLVVSPLLLTQADPTICHADAAHAGTSQAPAAPQFPAPHVPAAICPALLAIGLAAPVLATPQAILPAPRHVTLRAAPLPPARAPPLHRVASAKPRGPPHQV